MTGNSAVTLYASSSHGLSLAPPAFDRAFTFIVTVIIFIIIIIIIIENVQIRATLSQKTVAGELHPITLKPTMLPTPDVQSVTGSVMRSCMRCTGS